MQIENSNISQIYSPWLSKLNKKTIVKLKGDF